MDFWNDDNTTTDCDICHKTDDGTHKGHGWWDEDAQMYSFYLCPACEEAEANLAAAKQEQDRQEQEKRIAMHMSMS